MSDQRVLEAEALTQKQLLELDRSRVVVFWTVSPVEVHGPHLPLGTDIRVGEAVLRRAAGKLLARQPESLALFLPPLALGADVLPLPGSLQVSHGLLAQAIVEVGEGLHRAGFRTLVLGNNHGGPRHMLALEEARRRLQRRTGMVVVNPFGAFLRGMFERQPEVLRLAGLDSSSTLGGGTDVHAGAFETSLALAAFAEHVDGCYRGLPETRIRPASRVAGALRSAGSLIRRAQPLLGERAPRAARGLEYAAGLLDWMALENTPTYVGPPAQAAAAVGERALEGMAEQVVDLLQRALRGESADQQTKPLLWDLRLLARLPL